MLDDLKYIHEKDTQDALGVIEKQWQQLSYSYDVSLEKIDAAKINNIVWAGMGGSAIPAQVSLSWPSHPLPFEICRSYNLPEYVGKDTLVVASSHSGNTEETISALEEAEKVGAQIVVTSAGGKLTERAQTAGYPLYVIPSGIQPRMTTLYFLRALAHLYESLGLRKSLTIELEQASPHIEAAVANWRPDVPTSQNLAKKLAQELSGKSVVVYAGPKMQAVANKFKIALNENAKNIAWWNVLPEFNHNEFIGWSSHPIDKPYGIVDIRSNLEHPQVQKRFEVTERLLSGQRPAPHVVAPEGDTLLKQMLWGMVFCDFVSLYLALLNGLNPTPVDLVEKFKAELNK
jgi:glucose/mannose-6-phosphate isomerase